MSNDSTWIGIGVRTPTIPKYCIEPDPHVTLAYLGKSVGDYTDLLDIVFNWYKNFYPGWWVHTVPVTGVEKFGFKKTITVAKVKLPLMEHHRLMDWLILDHYPVATDFAFSPHVTLSHDPAFTWKGPQEFDVELTSLFIKHKGKKVLSMEFMENQ